MHEVLVNRLGGLSLPRKSVVRSTDRPDMTVDVYHGRKTTIVTFSALETSHSLGCTFYEFVKVCRCFYATNGNIHVLSMKFPHLFLRPEIIITFLWGWEWSGGQVRHRSPRNSGCI